MLPLLRQSTGAEHIDAVRMINNLACVRVLQKRFAEGNTLFDECLPSMRRLLGDDNYQVLQAATCHASCLNSAGKTAEAGATFEKLVPTLRRTLPLTQPLLLLSLSQYAMILQKQGKYTLAEPMWGEVAELRRKTLAAGNWLIGEAEVMQGTCLVMLGRFQQAEPVLLAGHDHLHSAQASPASAGMRQLARQALAIMYERWGKPDRAAAWRDPGKNGPKP